MIHPYKDNIEAWPHGRNLRETTGRSLAADAQAGLTVAIFAIPQAMAYSVMVGLPAAHGLYTAMITSALAALWGSSRFVNTGLTNSSALLTATALAPLATAESILPALAALCLLVGVLRMIFGLLRLGDVIHFVPDPVMIGFTTAIGIHIALGQIHHLLGMTAPGSIWLPARLFELGVRLQEAHWETMILGLATFAAMRLTRKWSRCPTALLAMLGGIVFTEVFHWQDHVKLAGDIGPLSSPLPFLTLPAVAPSIWMELAPAALAIAVIGSVEAVSIGQRLAMKHQQHLNVNQEFFGQGISQAVGAFFGCIPGSGSFSRSVLMEQSGARGVLANVFFAAFTLLAVWLAPGLLMRIPVACLAGLLLHVGISLLDPARMKRVSHTSRDDLYLMIATMAITLLTRVEAGIFGGILIGNILFLRRTRALRMPELVPFPDGHLEERPYTPESVHAPASIVALTVHGDLFYGVSKELRDQLMEIVRLQNPRIIILRIRRVFSIDYACWNAIFEFAAWFKQRQGAVYVSGVRPDVWNLIRDAGVEDVLPENQVFPKTDRLMEAFHIAVAAALVHLPEEIAPPPHWEGYLDQRHAPGSPGNGENITA